mgnify:CR=1 FL=1
MEGKRVEKDRGVESTREGKGWMILRSSEEYKKSRKRRVKSIYPQENRGGGRGFLPPLMNHFPLGINDRMSFLSASDESRASLPPRRAATCFL